MTQKRIKTFALLAALAGVLSLAGCAKKVAKVTPPPPPAPAPAAPTATLAANPSVIQQGQGAVLTWQTSNANEITIAGLGTLAPSGSRSVTPSESTTYTLLAKGPGGTHEASARITVNAAIASATPSPTDRTPAPPAGGRPDAAVALGQAPDSRSPSRPSGSAARRRRAMRSEEHTSELQSL